LAEVKELVGRKGRDYYVKHDKPKRLFARELGREARRSLQAEHLKPALAGVEAKVPPRCTHQVGPLRSQAHRFKEVPEFRARIESYPRWSLLSIVAGAMLCGAQRGPKALAGFAKKLSQAQRRALGIRATSPRGLRSPKYGLQGLQHAHRALDSIAPNAQPPGKSLSRASVSPIPSLPFPS
jgi:hypothetical protein